MPSSWGAGHEADANRQHVLSICAPGAVLGIFYSLPHLGVTTTLSWVFFSPQSTDGTAEAPGNPFTLSRS